MRTIKAKPAPLVTVYADPLTETEPIGQARVVLAQGRFVGVHNGRAIARCRVQFLPDTTVQRADILTTITAAETQDGDMALWLDGKWRVGIGAAAFTA